MTPSWGSLGRSWSHPAASNAYRKRNCEKANTMNPFYLIASLIPPARIVPSLAFGLLGPLGGLLGGSGGALGGLLGASWGPLGGLLGASWGLLGASWGHLGASRGHLGACLGRRLEMSVQVPPLGPILGPSWGPLGRSWGFLGPSWGSLGPCLSRLGGLSGRLGAILGASWTALDGVKAEEADMLKIYVFRREWDDFSLLGALLGRR